MSFNWSDIKFIVQLIFDILIVWLLLYSALRVLRNNARTIQIIKGALVILLIKGISTFFHLTAVSYIIDIFLNWGVVLVIVIFQPEIRGMLEKVGKSSTMFANLSSVQCEDMIQNVVDACESMSKTKTGALITIQQSHSLDDFVQTGVNMGSEVSSELLGTIFQYGTPMHDGAVIIQGNKIACAAAYFPTTTKDLPSKYGARHRAAVGISEITDSITIVVSEETGNISVATNGQLTQYSSAALKRYLQNCLLPKSGDETNTNSFLDPVIKTAKNFTTRNTKKQEKIIDERITPINVIDNISKGVE